MSEVAVIGKCKGCDRSPRRLDDGVCNDCLNHPKRGRKWAEYSYRVRNDPAFAVETWNNIGTLKPERALAGKLYFIRMYGLPPGVECPPELKSLLEAKEEPDEPPPRLRLVR